MRRLRKFFGWWLHRDPEGLEHAKQSAERASEELDKARRNGRQANQLLIRNHLSERFIREIRENRA